MSMGKTVADHFDKPEDFDGLLASADSNARPGREREFVDSVRDNFEKYKYRTFLSEKQAEWLTNIAARG